MTNTCRLKEPSVPFKTVVAVTHTYNDGTSEVKPGHADVGLIAVDGELLGKEFFDSLYTVDESSTLAAGGVDTFPFGLRGGAVMASTPVPAPRSAVRSLLIRKAEFVFSRNNLTQVSTFLALLHFVSGTGFLVITPEIQARVSAELARLFGDLFDMLAVVNYLKGVAKVLYNERKPIIVNTISTIAPVTVTGPATVETKI